MPIEKYNLPVGRIVGGNPAVAQDKTNFQTGQPVLKDGQKVQEWRCEIAIPKDKFGEVWQKMVQEAVTMFPINPQTGQPNVSRDFSWKFVDGDSHETPKRSKTPYNAREGYPGHYVLKISTEAFAPPIYKFENGAYRQIDPSEIKCGDYVVANVDIKVHNNNDGGLYINPNGFELVGYGTAISGTGGANPNELFGGQQHQLPQGASATPVGNAPAGMAMPTAPNAGYAPAVPGMPAGMMPNAATAVPVMNNAPMNPPVAAMPTAPLPAPAPDFVQNAGMPGNAAGFAGMPQAPMAAPSAGTAMPSPTNGLPPGLPQAR